MGIDWNSPWLVFAAWVAYSGIQSLIVFLACNLQRRIAEEHAVDAKAHAFASSASWHAGEQQMADVKRGARAVVAELAVGLTAIERAAAILRPEPRRPDPDPT